MGSILDTSVVIAAERQKLTQAQLLERVAVASGSEDIGFTTVVITELLHGIYRAKDLGTRYRRELFLERLIESIPVYAYTLDVSRVAAKIGGEQGALGYTIPFADLSIGATAITLGFSLMTSNERHFRMIPGLDIIVF